MITPASSASRKRIRRNGIAYCKEIRLLLLTTPTALLLINCFAALYEELKDRNHCANESTGASPC